MDLLQLSRDTVYRFAAIGELPGHTVCRTWRFLKDEIERMRSWPLLRAYFMSGEADMAFVMCPLAMDMFLEKPIFRWVGLMHRDGNALAINDRINAYVNLPVERIDRKPNTKVATAFARAKDELGRPTECGVDPRRNNLTVFLVVILSAAKDLPCNYREILRCAQNDSRAK